MGRRSMRRWSEMDPGPSATQRSSILDSARELGIRDAQQNQFVNQLFGLAVSSPESSDLKGHSRAAYRSCNTSSRGRGRSCPCGQNPPGYETGLAVEATDLGEDGLTLVDGQRASRMT